MKQDIVLVNTAAEGQRVATLTDFRQVTEVSQASDCSRSAVNKMEASRGFSPGDTNYEHHYRRALVPS